MLLCHIQRSASGARQRSRVPSLSHSPFLAEPLLPIRQISTEMTLLHVKTMTSQFFLISSRLGLSWQAAPRAPLTNEIEDSLIFGRIGNWIVAESKVFSFTIVYSSDFRGT